MRADLIAIVIATVDGEPLVWDVNPTPEFRDALPLFGSSVAGSIARAVELRLEALSAATLAQEAGSTWISLTREGIHGDIVVRA